MLSETENAIFDRTRLLLGDECVERISESRIIIFGVGGVGSWCAEGLVRSGVRHLTIVDSDVVSLSNINRQLMATFSNAGRPKVEALRDRLLDINPEAEIIAHDGVYNESTTSSFDFSAYDYVIDCIDSLSNKITLILNAATKGPWRFYSSMGAALKTDPTRVRTADFWSVRGCPLGAMLRKRIRQKGTLPQRNFCCVYSDEVLPNRGGIRIDDGKDADAAGLPKKAQINGTTAHVTAIFGFTLAGLVIQDIDRRLPLAANQEARRGAVVEAERNA